MTCFVIGVFIAISIILIVMASINIATKSGSVGVFDGLYLGTSLLMFGILCGLFAITGCTSSSY